MTSHRLASNAPTTEREPDIARLDPFLALDDRLTLRESKGVVWVEARPESWPALEAHVARRSEAIGRRVVRARPSEWRGEPWRDIVLMRGALGSQDPLAVALALTAGAENTVIVVAGARATAWGRAVACALSSVAHLNVGVLVIALERPGGEAELSRWGVPTFLGDEDATSADVRVCIDELTDRARQRFWDAIVVHESFAVAPFATRIEELEDAWRRARVNVPPRSVAGAAGAQPVVAEKFVSADPWTRMCAAESAAQEGCASAALARALEAIRAATDAHLRCDLWARWDACLAWLEPTPGAVERLVASAELAFVFGDSERAERYATEAMRREASRFDVLVIRGRAATVRGDVVDATLLLRRAVQVAETIEHQAWASAMLAETRYVAGDPADASAHAQRALDALGQARPVADGRLGPLATEAHLAARNVFGKLLLAKECWTEAEEHFAIDALDASIAGLLEEELRARLNRAVAVLSDGRRDEARRQFSEVLAQGAALGNERAKAYATSNLAAIAILEHRYEDALDLSERAIALRRRMGERVLLVLPVTNLAELRLRLGLIDEAAQALRFGVQACGDALPLSRRAYFSKMVALIRLERGELVEAARELALARAGAMAAADSGLLGQIERIAARIALEDGDVVAARRALDAAAPCRNTPSGRAEVAWLEAELARALGEPDALTRVALAATLAERADDAELLREIYVLRSQLELASGDAARARDSLLRAASERDRVAAALSQERGRSYRARGRVALVDDLLAALDGARTSTVPACTALPGTRSKEARPLIGDSAAIRGLLSAVARVARTNATVLVCGPTGSGKELVAEAIHAASARARGPLVTVNCAALVDTLLLSELFGHERGAYTGAMTRRLGRFELAAGGTLFLDEIGDISPRTQAALLRVLQDGTFERVGGSAQLQCDVRVVCATHRDLRASVARGEFREDLYFRLCGVALDVPPLRDRLDDLPALCTHLLARVAASAGVPVRPLTSDALALLAQHDWPGNVRELENVLRAVVVLGCGPRVDAADLIEFMPGRKPIAVLPSALLGATGGPTSGDAEFNSKSRGAACDPSPTFASGYSSADVVYAEIRNGTGLADIKRKLERDCITRALVEAGGNITHAAELLGMKRPRLSQLVKEYRLAVMLEESTG